MGSIPDTVTKPIASGPRPEPETRLNGRLITAVVADDSAFCRDLVRRIIDGWPAVKLLGAAVDGLEALEMVAWVRPDLALLDLHMPRIDGLRVTRLIRKFHAATRVIVVTDDPSEQVKEACLTQGADGFISKERLHCDLRHRIAELFPKSIGSQQEARQPG